MVSIIFSFTGYRYLVGFISVGKVFAKIFSILWLIHFTEEPLTMSTCINKGENICAGAILPEPLHPPKYFCIRYVIPIGGVIFMGC